MTKTVTASKIVRALVKLSPPEFGYVYVYNDKTSFGHSIKVTRWSHAQYSNAARFLQHCGFEVKIRSLPRSGRWGCPTRMVHRLHVVD